MSLLILLFIIFTPIIEIIVFLEAGARIGLWPTVSFVIVTAMIGSVLLRYQGLSTLFSVRESMNAGKLPINELFNGFCLFAAGAFLIIPGFITDGLGLVLLLPIFRSILKKFIGKRLKAPESLNLYAQSGFEQEIDQTPSPDIIDGEYHEIMTNSDSKSEVVDDKKPLAPPNPKTTAKR